MSANAHVEAIRAAARELALELLRKHGQADNDLRPLLEVALEQAIAVARSATSLEKNLRVVEQHTRQSLVTKLRRPPAVGASLSPSSN